MDKKKFDELMDKWASHEMNTAPEINPTAEVYQKLKDKQKKSRFMAIPWSVRWAAAGIAAAAVILFIILQPSEEIGPIIGLRGGFVGEKGEGVEKARVLNEMEAPKEEKAPTIAQAPRAAGKDIAKREKKSQVINERFVFQYQHPDTHAVEQLDIRDPQDKAITLSSEDNYRLVLELARERYVYVYLIGEDQSLVRLFPNTEYQPAQNPLQPGKTYIFPPPPNWYFLQEAKGEVMIYVIASDQPQPEWDDMYARYEDMEKKKERKEILLQQTAAFKSIKETPQKDILILPFKFYSQ